LLLLLPLSSRWQRQWLLLLLSFWWWWWWWHQRRWLLLLLSVWLLLLLLLLQILRELICPLRWVSNLHLSNEHSTLLDADGPKAPLGNCMHACPCICCLGFPLLHMDHIAFDKSISTNLAKIHALCFVADCTGPGMDPHPHNPSQVSRRHLGVVCKQKSLGWCSKC